MNNKVTNSYPRIVKDFLLGHAAEVFCYFREKGQVQLHWNGIEDPQGFFILPSFRSSSKKQAHAYTLTYAHTGPEPPSVILDAVEKLSHINLSYVPQLHSH